MKAKIYFLCVPFYRMTLILYCIHRTQYANIYKHSPVKRYCLTAPVVLATRPVVVSVTEYSVMMPLGLPGVSHDTCSDVELTFTTFTANTCSGLACRVDTVT